MNELGFYTLAGAPESPRDLIDEIRRAEAMGLGSAFISERFNIKEAATLSGAAGAVSERIGIATAATKKSLVLSAVVIASWLDSKRLLLLLLILPATLLLLPGRSTAAAAG